MSVFESPTLFSHRLFTLSLPSAPTSITSKYGFLSSASVSIASYASFSVSFTVTVPFRYSPASGVVFSDALSYFCATGSMLPTDTSGLSLS